MRLGSTMSKELVRTLLSDLFNFPHSFISGGWFLAF